MSDNSSELPPDDGSSVSPFSPPGQAGVRHESPATGQSFQSPPPQPVWPPPPAGASVPTPSRQYSSVNGTMILILGILSIVVCGICGPIAWVMGNQAMATLNRYGDPLNQRNMVIAGRICGIIGTAFLGLGILYYIGLVVFGIVSSMGTHR